MTEKIDFQAFMAGLEEGQNAEYEAAFKAYCDLEKLEADRARCAAAAEQSTGLERESNIRQIAEIGAAINRVQATLKAIQEGGGITAPLWRGTSFDGGLTGRELKYQRFDAEDVAEALRYEIEARQAKLRAEQTALSNELFGPYKATWDFWQALFERRDVKALADFEGGDEFQAALEYSIRALETSPGWARHPEREERLVQYRRRRIERAAPEPKTSPVMRKRDYVAAAVDRIAAHCETQKIEFDRNAMPGDAGDLRWLMGKLHPALFAEMEQKTFQDHYRGVCGWLRSAGHQDGARNLYLEVFPEIKPQLAGVIQLCK